MAQGQGGTVKNSPSTELPDAPDRLSSLQERAVDGAEVSLLEEKDAKGALTKLRQQSGTGGVCSGAGAVLTVAAAWLCSPSQPGALCSPCQAHTGAGCALPFPLLCSGTAGSQLQLH